jgi:hypothetical protein
MKIIKTMSASDGYKQVTIFTPPAFHPKALRLFEYIWQVFWLVSVYCLPVPSEAEQWLRG